MEYILNDSVIFKETEGLRYKQQAQVAIPMSILQAGVLAELVKAHGKPVHRDELLDRVWERNGYLASNNSLNHNIGFLRKSLKDCGINDAIITVHRVGFKLEKMVDVKVYRTKVESHKNNNLCDNSSENEMISHQSIALPLNKQWRPFGKGRQKKDFFSFSVSMVACCWGYFWPWSLLIFSSWLRTPQTMFRRLLDVKFTQFIKLIMVKKINIIVMLNTFYDRKGNVAHLMTCC
ncbi:transcriptional regulator [Serratia fonticola]|uniref:transcriptional regulator n=1 Tax=Serratia fonticola TaxID=47917 RepID=UPI00093DBCF3|nr:winged helix-turn-helix domain-containing protein [Serratia fonticola]OKP21416.1 hypothetical protein BSQ40_25920 [Serratia fonticola]